MLTRRLSVAVSLCALASCVAPAPREAPAPIARPPATVRPAPPPPAPSTDWRDWPLTPGDWTYRRTATGSNASYGSALSLICDGATRRITLAREDGGTGTVLTVRTSSTLRTLPVAANGDRLLAVLAGSDPLFDAMGFSRGRFVIEQAGRAPLVVPAWPEILRVAEDCRG